ncbi:MAG TPA: hypothetical protein VMI31_02135 [Fimbriimonadaceae bacterium]|nr:hypothetical protein [Fimbriimonadaceae bacterium]
MERSVVLALVLAFLGCGAICLGSLFGIAAPGDGQTGMFLFPLWGIGAILGIASIANAYAARARTWAWLAIALLALVAIASVVWSFIASARYEPPHPPSGPVP